MPRSHIGIGGYSAFVDARALAKRKRIPQARRKINTSLKSIGLAYERAVLAKRKPDITREQKQRLNEKIKKLRTLQEWNLDLAKTHNIKLR